MLRRDVLAAAAALFAIMVAHTTLETARDALFLARIGPAQLAWVYLAMAAVALGTFALARHWTTLRDPRRLLLIFLAGATLGTGAFALGVSRSRGAVFAFYVWTGLVVTVIVPSFWTLLDRSLRIGDAKRAFATIGAGGVIGAMVGSALAGALGRVMPASALLVAGTAGYALATACAFVLAPRRVLAEARVRSRAAETLSRSARRYVVLLVAVGTIATVALTLGELLFKRVVARSFEPDQLAMAFGAIYAGVNAIGLIVQLAITPRVLARWGVGPALAILPALLAGTGFSFAATGAIAAAIALELADGGLRHSVHAVGSELLYLPVPASVREAYKPVADAIALRGGEAIAALVAVALGLVGGDARAYAYACAAIAVCWLVGTRVLRRAYVAQFRATLQAGEIERDAPLPALDTEALELLHRALASADPLEASTALDLLAGRDQIPVGALDHPDALVVQRALALLERDERPEIQRAIARLLDHDDVGIRAAALAATSGSIAYRERRIAALADPDLRIRTAALVGLADDPEYMDAAVVEIANMVARSTGDRRALAEAIAHAPRRDLHHVLYELLAWHEPDVVRLVLGVLARDPAAADLDRLLGLLAQPDVRGDVRRVFFAAGERGLDRLIAALEDDRTPRAVHRHLPRTISRFGSPRAAATLVSRLLRESDEATVYKILRALGRMRAARPDLRIDEAMVRSYAARAVAEAARYATLADSFAARDSFMLVIELLHEQAEGAIEHAFRALGILWPHAGLRTLHDALVGDDDARRGAAREVLEARVPAELRNALLALVDRSSADERRARLGALACSTYGSDEELLADLRSDPHEAVRSVAAYRRLDARA